LIIDKDRDLFRDKDRIRLEIQLSCHSDLYKESNIFRKAALGSTKPGCSLFLELSIADLEANSAQNGEEGECRCNPEVADWIDQLLDLGGCGPR
jgi:hypothetical protein